LKLIKLISREGAVTILKELEDSKKRFSELQEKVSKTTLNRRLEEMRGEGLVERIPKGGKKPPEVYYGITKKGQKLISPIEEIERISQQ